MNELELLYAAVEAKIGIKFTCSDPTPIRMRLYKLRRELLMEDSRLEAISILESPTDKHELWILKRYDNASIK